MVKPVARRPLRRQQRPVIASLDNAGVLVQRHAREVVIGSALIILPGVILTLIATTLSFDRYQSLKGSVVSVPELVGGQRAATGIEDVILAIGLLLNNLAACLVGGYVATLVVRRQMGASVSIRAGYRAMVPRLPALFVAWVFGHCWLPLAGLALSRVRGGGVVTLIVLGIPAVLMLVTLTLVVSPVIVIERLGPFAAIRRSIRLARTDFGALYGFAFCSVVIGLVVQYGIAYLPRLSQATGLVAFGRFGWLIEGVAGQLGRLISIPLVAAATAFVYVEVRMSREGMDLVIDADRAFGTAA
jgi:hypothetical protein